MHDADARLQAQGFPRQPASTIAVQVTTEQTTSNLPAIPASAYTGVRLTFFVAPQQSSAYPDDINQAHARLREVKFERNLQDAQESEAASNKTELVRFRSFFDGNTYSTYGGWAGACGWLTCL